MSHIQSRPNNPNPAMCCEACVYGRGEHADWCIDKMQNQMWREMDAAMETVNRDYERSFHIRMPR